MQIQSHQRTLFRRHLTLITHKSLIRIQIKNKRDLKVLYQAVEFRRPFDVIGNHSEKNILSLQQSRQRRPIVPTYRRAITGQYPLLCYIFASTASDIPCTRMKRQISVIKGCKVDLQLGSEYRTRVTPRPIGRARSRGTAPRINLLETNDNRGCGYSAARSVITRSAVAGPIRDSIESRCVLYDHRWDGNTGNKIPTMEMSDAAERRRNYARSLL